jgi:hypothetical protein
VFGLAVVMDRGVQVENSGSSVSLLFHSSVSSRFCKNVESSDNIHFSCMFNSRSN